MVLEAFDTPLVMRDRAMPVPEAHEVLLRVRACGVCRTDLSIIDGKHPGAKKLPLVPGHEIAGEVVDVGKEGDRSYIGKRVVVYHYLYCGECAFCKSGRESLCRHPRGVLGFNTDGGFSEYIKVPAGCTVPIGEETSFERAAIIPDAVATPYHAVMSKAKIRPGELLAVLGAGGLGIHAIQIAAGLGARVIALDINEEALSVAGEMGAERTVDVRKENPFEAVMDFSRGAGVDAAIDFVGNEEMDKLAIQIVRTGGRFVLVGYDSGRPFQIGFQPVVAKELEILGSRACSREDVTQSVELVARLKVKPFVTEVYPLGEANAVLARLRAGNIVGRSVLML